LPRAEKDNGRHLTQAVFDERSDTARDHGDTGNLTTDVKFSVFVVQAGLRQGDTARPEQGIPTR
jgi:hypothetical protein